MKPVIAHIHEKFLGVSETFIYQFLTNAESTRPVVLCAERRYEELFPWPDVEVMGYPSKFSPAVLRAVALKRSGVAPFLSSMTPLYRAHLQKIRPALVHAHFGTGAIKVMEACVSEQIPLVVSFYGYDLSAALRDPAIVRAYKRLFEVAVRVIALSENFRERLMAAGCPPEKVRVVRVGVRPDSFVYRDPVSRGGGDEVRFCGVARLVEKKGTQYTLEALAQAREQFPGLRYTHIGDGPLLPELNNLVSSLNLQDAVHFRGAQPSDAVRTLMRSSDIFVMPSITAENGDQEGIPGVIYEAMATGLPVISTFHSGIPEVVSDSETGFLVPERDANSLAEKMLHLARNRDDWQRLARNGRKIIEQGFDVRNETAKLEAIYQECLSPS